MAGKMTRKTLNDFLLACKDDVCIIPAPLFGEFIQGMKIRDEKFLESTSKLCQTQDRLCSAIEHIASNMHSEETNVHRPPADDPNMLHETLVKIGEKLNMLTEAVREGAISFNNKMAGEKVLFVHCYAHTLNLVLSENLLQSLEYPVDQLTVSNVCDWEIKATNRITSVRWQHG